MRLFRKGYELTLNRVQDTVTFKEGNEKLTLHVSGDSFRMVAGINKVNTKLKAFNDDTKDEEYIDTARLFASVIFGSEQAEKLFTFYANDPGCIIAACGNYFKERLAVLIAKQQKKLK